MLSRRSCCCRVAMLTKSLFEVMPNVTRTSHDQKRKQKTVYTLCIDKHGLTIPFWHTTHYVPTTAVAITYDKGYSCLLYACKSCHGGTHVHGQLPHICLRMLMRNSPCEKFARRLAGSTPAGSLCIVLNTPLGMPLVDSTLPPAGQTKSVHGCNAWQALFAHRRLLPLTMRRLLACDHCLRPLYLYSKCICSQDGIVSNSLLLWQGCYHRSDTTARLLAVKASLTCIDSWQLKL